MTPKYQFVETGAGCAEHGDPLCLCDVVIDKPTPLNFLPKDLAHTGLAMDLCKKEHDKVTFEDWAAWLFTVADEAKRINAAELADIIAEAREQRFAPAIAGGDTRTGIQKAYPQLLARGFNTYLCADILGVYPEELVAGLNLRALDFKGFMQLERLLQEGELSTAEIQKELGADYHTVANHAARMNITPPPGKKGLAQSPAVRACIEAGLAEGLAQRKVVAKVLNETGVRISQTHVMRVSRGLA